MHLLLPTIWLVLALPLSAATLLSPILGDGDFELGIGNWAEIGTKNTIVSTPATGLATPDHYSSDRRGFIAIDLGVPIVVSQSLTWSYNWTADAAFKTAGSSVNLLFFYTADNTVTGTVSGVITANSGLLGVANTYEAESGSVAFTDPGAAGRQLFLGLRASTYTGTRSADNAFFHVDNISVTSIPEPGPFYIGLPAGLLVVLRRRRPQSISDR